MTIEEFTRKMKFLANDVVELGALRQLYWTRFYVIYLAGAGVASLVQLPLSMVMALILALYGRWMAKNIMREALEIRDGILQDMEKTLNGIREP